MIQKQARARAENVARWFRAAERALAEGVQVRQLQGSGQRIATSGSHGETAYALAVTGNVAPGCECLAGLNGDPDCKQRAAFYLLIGALYLSPEPEPSASALSCPECNGAGTIFVRDCARYGWPFRTCLECPGTGVLPSVAELDISVRATLEPQTCDHCEESLDTDAGTDAAFQTLRGACIEVSAEKARAARQAAIAANPEHASTLARTSKAERRGGRSVLRPAAWRREGHHAKSLCRRVRAVRAVLADLGL